MRDENRSWREMCVLGIFYFYFGKASELFVFKYLAKIIAIPKFQVVYFHWKWCRYCSWKLPVIFGSVRILTNRVNGPCSEQGRNPNSQLSSAISPSTLHIEPQDHNHSQEPCEWFGHDIQVLLVKLEQILHLKVDCSDFGPVRDRGPYLNA